MSNRSDIVLHCLAPFFQFNQVNSRQHGFNFRSDFGPLTRFSQVQSSMEGLILASLLSYTKT